MSSNAEYVIQPGFALVGEWYFKAVADIMEVVGGFELISQVSITSAECPYHVPVTFARETRMFFHVPGKAIIVQLQFNESDALSLGELNCRWSFRLYFQFRPGDVLAIVNRKSNAEPDDKSDPWEGIPFFTRGVVFPGFLQKTGYYWEQSTPVGQPPMEPHVLAVRLTNNLTTVRKYLSRGFGKLQVMDFVPYYIFPGSGDLFWEKFDTAKLRDVVAFPWGG